MQEITPKILAAINQNPHPQLAEKDFMECAVLASVFDDPYFADTCVYSGGGTLTRAYDISPRRNYDIDLAFCDFTSIDVTHPHTKKQLAAFRSAFRKLVFGKLYRHIESILNTNSELTIVTDAQYNLRPGQTPAPTLHILYPSHVHDGAGHLCIEFTPRTYAPEIIEVRTISPYSIKTPTVTIPTVRFEQTFWDKAYALHSYAHIRPANFHPTVSRHYYDVATMAPHINIARTEHMLQNIASYQEKYTTRPVPHPGTPADLTLVPDAELCDIIGTDYAASCAAGILPPGNWRDIIQTLATLEQTFRQTQR